MGERQRVRDRGEETEGKRQRGGTYKRQIERDRGEQIEGNN